MEKRIIENEHQVRVLDSLIIAHPRSPPVFVGLKCQDMRS